MHADPLGQVPRSEAVVHAVPTLQVHGDRLVLAAPDDDGDAVQGAGLRKRTVFGGVAPRLEVELHGTGAQGATSFVF